MADLPPILPTAEDNPEAYTVPRIKRTLGYIDQMIVRNPSPRSLRVYSFIRLACLEALCYDLTREKQEHVMAFEQQFGESKAEWARRLLPPDEHKLMEDLIILRRQQVLVSTGAFSFCSLHML